MYNRELRKVELGDFSLGVGFLYISQTILNYIYELKGGKRKLTELAPLFLLDAE